MSLLPTACVLVPLGTALVAALFGRRSALQRGVSLAGVTVYLACALALLVAVAKGGPIRTSIGGWPAPFGVELVADPLAAGMVLVAAVVAASVLVFQLAEIDPAPRAPMLLPMVHAMLAAVSGAFLTGDLFNLYVWFELMLVTSLGLLAYRTWARHLHATLEYFVLNTLGTLLLLVGVVSLYAATGHLGFGALRTAARAGDVAQLAPFFGVVVVGLLVKAGAFPVFAWLPASYPTLPTPLLALFAALLTKVAVYALLRLTGGIFPLAPEHLFVALRWIAAATMLTGVLGAAHHWDLRRILAFHVISQVGYMLLGVALATDAGRVSAVVYLVHHIVVKANLFLIAALVHRHTGSFDLRCSGGLYAARPALAALFAVPALSLVGLPPLSGFWAKLLVVWETLAEGYYVLAAVALLVGFGTLYSMGKVWLYAFWRAHPDPSWRGPDGGRMAPAYVATGVLALFTTYLGVAPDGLLRVATLAIGALPGGMGR